MPTPSARGKESTIVITYDGETMTGGFNKIMNFRENPDAEIAKTNFVGADGAEGDLDINGTGGTFETHHTDHVVRRLWKRIKDRERAHLPPLPVVITVIRKYRDPSVPSGTQQFKNVILKLDSDETPDKGFQKATWSWFSNDFNPEAS